MVATESYTLKEIILGLREEYRKRESQLSGLKALCFVDKKSIIGIGELMFGLK